MTVGIDHVYLHPTSSTDLHSAFWKTTSFLNFPDVFMCKTCFKIFKTARRARKHFRQQLKHTACFSRSFTEDDGHHEFWSNDMKNYLLCKSCFKTFHSDQQADHHFLEMNFSADETIHHYIVIDPVLQQVYITNTLPWPIKDHTYVPVRLHKFASSPGQQPREYVEYRSASAMEEEKFPYKLGRRDISFGCAVIEQRNWSLPMGGGKMTTEDLKLIRNNVTFGHQCFQT